MTNRTFFDDRLLRRMGMRVALVAIGALLAACAVAPEPPELSSSQPPLEQPNEPIENNSSLVKPEISNAAEQQQQPESQDLLGESNTSAIDSESVVQQEFVASELNDDLAINKPEPPVVAIPPSFAKTPPPETSPNSSTPQPLVVGVEQLQLQRSDPLAEISVQALQNQPNQPELLAEDRAPQPAELVGETQEGNASADTLSTEANSSTEDLLYQDQVQQLLAAQMASYERRYLEAYNIYLQLALTNNDPRLSASAYVNARNARDNKRINEALDLWLQQQPDSRQAHQLKLVQLLQSGQPQQALQSLERLYFLGADIDFSLPATIIIHPSEMQVRSLIADYESLAAKYQERDDIFAALIMLRIYLVNILYLQQRYDDADRQMTILSAISRGWQSISSATVNSLALLEAELKEKLLSDVQLDSWYQSAVQRYPDSLQLQLRRLQRSSNPERSARVLFTRLLANGDLEALLALRAQASTQGLDATNSNIDFYLSQRHVLGNRNALLGLIQIAQQSGELALADEYLAQLYEDPDIRSQAYFERLKMWLDDGQLDISQQIYRSAWQEQHIEREQSSLIYAQALTSSKYYNEAISLLSYQLQESAQATPILQARSEAYIYKGDYALMEADLRQIIATNPEDGTAYNTLGYVLADINTRLDEAERLITRALQIDPENPAYIDSLGWLKFRQGDLGQARLFTEQAHRLWQDAEISAHLGEIYWVQGERERAIYVWLDALDRNPQHQVLLQTIVRMTGASEDTDLDAHLVARLQTILPRQDL